MAGIFNGIGDLITGGGGGPDFPEQTPQERANQQAQTDLLNQQRLALSSQLNQQNLVAPYIYRQMGLEPVYGANGQITGFNQLPPTAEQLAQQHALTTQQAIADAQLQSIHTGQLLQPIALQQIGYNIQRDDQGNITGLTLDPNSTPALQDEVNRALLGRTKQAIAGTLPVDPALDRQFTKSEGILRESLRKNLGPGYDTSTPGIEALADYNQRKNETLYGAQHGEIGYADQLAQAGQAVNNANLGAAEGSGLALRTAMSYQNPFATPGVSQNTAEGYLRAIQAPFSGSSGLGTLSQLYNNPLQYGTQQRQLQYGGDYNQDMNNMNHQFWRNLASSAGSTLGKGAGGGFA